MDPAAVAFVLTYLGMLAGRIPGLAIDRTGVALLGAILVLATGAIDLESAWLAVDVPTIALLFSLMIVSAQLRVAGFYTAVTLRLAARQDSPERLLLMVVLVAGALSALLANDVVCLAMTPILVDVAVRRRLDPVPFVLGLAAGANVGSAATLIGNPQNMLIGETLDLSFAGYFLDAAPVAALGLVATWWIVARVYRGRFDRELTHPELVARPLDRWQSAKVSILLTALVVVFLFTQIPRELAALTAAGLILLTRRTPSRETLGLVDWQLVVLFVALFVVHEAFARTGAVDEALLSARAGGLDPGGPPALFALAVVASNLVSNVPAVMLLLPATTVETGALLAIASTLAGNLILVGSIANLIAVEQAARLGIAPRSRSWVREHLAVGVPVTVVTLAIAAAWLAVRS